MIVDLSFRKIENGEGSIQRYTMNNLKNVSMEELFEVLVCGKEPIKGVTLLEYMEEWNSRVKKDGGYEVIVE